MDTEIIVALVGAVATIAAVIISNNRNATATDAKLDKQQAVMETKIDMLASEVRDATIFTKRVPVIEEQICNLNKRVDAVEKKVDKLNQE